MPMSVKEQVLIAIVVGAFSVAVAVTSTLLLNKLKLNPVTAGKHIKSPEEERKMLATLQIVNGVFAGIGLLLALWLGFRVAKFSNQGSFAFSSPL